MSSYAGDFAELYDLFHSNKPYEEEADFVDRLIRAHADGPSNTLLDIACGTGRHAARLSARGWSVVGVDVSTDMLEVAAARTAGLDVSLVRQDMTRLDLETNEFDAAICLFDSIGYGVDNDSVTATLSGVRRHLRSEALFVVEFWHAPAMVVGHDPVRVREWDVPDGRVVRIARTALDVRAQTATVEYTVYRLRADRSFAEWHETHTNRFFMIQEMASLLQAAGFTPIVWLAGYDDAGPIDATTWHVVVGARATSPAAR